MYMYKIIKNVHKFETCKSLMRQKESFWNWYKMMGMGIIKALKYWQNLYQVVVCTCAGAFSNVDLGLTLTIFMTGSNLFLMLLYGWQLIALWVLLYFQVCSNSAYPQHIGERYRTNGHLVYHFLCAFFTCIYAQVGADNPLGTKILW